MTPLRTILLAWDGASVDDLSSMASEWKHEAAYGARLVHLASDADVQVAATWLLKQHLDTHGMDNLPAMQDLYLRLDDIVVPEARLHVLQVMPYIPIPEDALDSVERFLDACLHARHTFVRAWSYTGWYELARAFPDYRPQVDAMLQDGLEHGKASEKARIRNIISKRQ